ncbi:MAG: hypothetical protein F4126_11580 [Acidimicrobiaceae bacterium]|nr:hypothetical protein [Acidimicrobiaceae bacterium]MYB87679.1 hypothetical protein [Acidimicrobiaceae bacterium]MYH94339.1 hypothetical protein [Acidimicrobiaceae bacterium]
MTSDESGETLVQPGVFIDRGVLIDLFQFWDACKAVGASGRLHELTGWNDLKALLDSAGVDTDGTKQRSAMNRGMNAFRGLISSFRSHRLYSSRVCWSELHHTLLEARALEALVVQGVPQSLRAKRPQMMYRVALQESDYDELNAQFDTFRDSLNLDYGIDVIDVEDPARRLSVTPGDIWEGAREVWSQVLMDVLDAYVCAAALLVEAKILLSDDPVLRYALELLNDPGRDWTLLREALGLAPDAAFPTPHTPRYAPPADP